MMLFIGFVTHPNLLACVIGVFGAFVLAVDKGALCLTMSAFDTLPEDQFIAFTPFLQVIVSIDGLLFIVW